MNPWLVKIFLWFISSKTAHKTVVNIMDGITHRTDNYDDDEIVHAFARALDIRLPDHEGQEKLENIDRKEDGMILMPETELVEFKAKRNNPIAKAKKKGPPR